MNNEVRIELCLDLLYWFQLELQRIIVHAARFDADQLIVCKQAHLISTERSDISNLIYGTIGESIVILWVESSVATDESYVSYALIN